VANAWCLLILCYSFLSQSSRAVVVDDNSNDSTTTTTTTTPFKYPSLMDEPSLFHDATAPKTPPRLDIPHSKQAHPALMTPPSTPSSSIRTTGSISTDDAASVSTAATTVFDHEIEGPKSRFLLVSFHPDFPFFSLTEAYILRFFSSADW